MSKKLYLSTQEYLNYSKMSMRGLRYKVKSGELTPVKEGKKLFFYYTQLHTKEAQDAFLRDRGLLPREQTKLKAEREFMDLKPWERKQLEACEGIVLEYLEEAKDVPRGGITTFKADFASRHGISISTLDRKIKLFKEGGRYALIPSWSNGNQSRIIDAKMGKIIQDLYMRPLGPSVRETQEKLHEIFNDEYSKLPSYRTLAAYINERWTKSEQLLVRNKEAWDRLYSPHVRRDWASVAVNEIWFGDAKQIDVACFYKNKPVFPWFTAFLDAKSRKFVGWVLTPGHDKWSIAQAFVNGVRGHGVPATIYIDRGRPYRSLLIAGSKLKEGQTVKAFDGIEETIIPGIIRDLKCEIFYAAPYNAREKIIEPNFKVFTQRLKHLPGYRGHSTRTRPKKLEQEIKSGKILSLRELDEEVVRVLNDRNDRPHSTTGKSPDSYYRDHVLVIPSENYLAYLLMDSHIVTVKDSSVLIQGMLYRGEDLWKLSGEKIEARRDPQDLKRAAIIHKGQFLYFASLETPDHYRSEITLESVKTAQRIRKRVHQYRKEIIECSDSLDDPIRKAIDSKAAEKVRARDIRPASSSVRSIHEKERLAKDVISGMKEFEVDQGLAKKVVAGSNGLSRIIDAYEDSAPKKKRLKLFDADDLF